MCSSGGARLHGVASRVVLVLLAASAAAAASSPFLQLGDSQALANTSKPGDGFSVQDKLVPCNGQVVLIDLDSDTSFSAFPPQATLQQCGASVASRRIQQWSYAAAGASQLSLTAPPPYLFPATCLDQGGVFINVSVYPWLCRNASDAAHSNQLYTFANNRVYSNATGPKYPQPGQGVCLAAGVPGEAAKLETGLTMQLCDAADDAAQAFAYNSSDGTLRHLASGLCVDAGVIGRTLSWNGAAWSTQRIVPHACPDSGNPALLPRDRVGTYVVGHTAIGGDPAKGDRLLVIGGDDSSNNVYWSDDCGKTWECYDGPQPWTVFGLSYAPLLTLDALPGSPLILAGGLQNTPGGGTAPSAALYYTFDGGAGEWQRSGYDLPLAAGVFPGAIAQDARTVYLFGGADTGFAVWSVDEGSYQAAGFAQIPGSANAQGADVGRRVYLRGSASGGCFFATDFSPGQLWAQQPRSPPIASSNAFFTARNATGPWLAYTAPWAPRASAAVAPARDGARVFVAGGVGFAGGAPTGEVLSDAWQVDAGVCLLGAGGAVCSGHGEADLATVSCACAPAWAGDDRCASCAPGFAGPDCAPAASNSQTPSRTRAAAAPSRSPAAPQTPSPSPGGGGGGGGGGLSAGSTAAIAVSGVAIGALAALLVWTQLLGGGPALSAALARVSGAVARGVTAGGGVERTSLLTPRAAGGGASAAAAAARFGAVAPRRK